MGGSSKKDERLDSASDSVCADYAKVWLRSFRQAEERRHTAFEEVLRYRNRKIGATNDVGTKLALPRITIQRDVSVHYWPALNRRGTRLWTRIYP